MMRFKNQKEYIGFNDWPFMLIGIPVVSFFIPLLFFTDTITFTFWGYVPSFLASMIHTIIYWLSIRTLSIVVRRQLPLQQDIGKRIMYTAVGAAFIFVVVDRSLSFLDQFCLPENHTTPQEIKVALASIFVIIFCLAIYEGFYLNYKWKLALLEREQLERENIESQLEGLRNQVNPHFLFNSLNTLAYIIPEEPEKAVKFVQKLSKVYRYILEIRDKKLVSVKEELEFLNAYCFLLKQRFGENIQIDIQVPVSAYNDMVIPLSMQMLFENAIKHNVISTAKPLNILVALEGNMIHVSNNLQRKQQEMPSTKVGLQNIKSRYSFFTNQEVVVNEDQGIFFVKLPLINAPNKALA